MGRTAIIIPVFQHGDEIENTILKILDYELPIIVINDGSDVAQSELIESCCIKHNVTLVSRSKNGGKGAAVIDGLYEAARLGYSHALQLDADGQHELSKISDFLTLSHKFPDDLILGYAVYTESAPLGRRIGRWATHIWIWINTLSFQIRDSMCGFRIYPIESVLNVIRKSKIGKHMDFDPEVCVRSYWGRIEIKNIPVRVEYFEGQKSNFRMFDDNLLITIMHTRLFFGMLIRLPGLLRLNFTRSWKRLQGGVA